jgi:hypothetical protein
MTTSDPYRTNTSGSTVTDRVVLTIGACATTVAIIAIFVDHGQLRTAARLLLYATVVVGLVVTLWAGWNVVRTDGLRLGGSWQTVMVWASVLAILMPVSALILRHHDKLVNCKAVRTSVRPADHRQLYPPYSREAKKCGINTYIAHLDQIGKTKH